MTKIKAQATFGNFKWVAEGEFETPVLEELAGFGLLQVLQRGPSSAAEKAMAGYAKRPTGFKRDSIGFSPEAAAMLETAYEQAKLKIEEKEYALGLVVAVEEYKSEAKYAQAIEIVKGKGGDATRLGDLAKKVGFEYEEETELTTENVGFLEAVRVFVKGI